jgi:translation initiation factor IF-3
LRKRSKVPPKPAPPEPRINERIRVPEVRLIDEEGRQVGIVKIREVRMKPKIDDHDIDFKTRTAAKLLKQGDKVKVTVMFRGREITHPQIGKALLDRVTASLDHIATVEKDAMLEGRHMTIILAPDKKKIAALARAAAAAAAAGQSPAEEEEDEAVAAAAAEARVVGDDGNDQEDDDGLDDDDDEAGDEGD